MRRLLAVTLLALLACGFTLDHAAAQATVQQSGPVTAGNCAVFAANGIIRDCGFPPASVQSTCPVRIIKTGSADNATVADCAILWDSATASTKSEALYTCNAPNKNRVVIVADEAGTAATYPITASAHAGDTINASSSLVVTFNLQSYSMKCDGSGNWILT